MQVGSTVWNGDRVGVVLSSDETGVTVAYFESVETLTSDADNPSPLSSSPTEENAPAVVTAPAAEVVEPSNGDEPPPPAAQVPADAKVVESTAVEVDPLAALTADERATFERLQGKVNASSGA